MPGNHKTTISYALWCVLLGAAATVVALFVSLPPSVWQYVGGLPRKLRDWTELVYFLCSAVLAGVAIYAARQVRLAAQQVRIMQQDARTRNERAAKENAIEYATRYLTTFLPMVDRYAIPLANDKELLIYLGPVSDFSPESIPDEAKEKLKRRLDHAGWRQALNELESIAAAYVCGVADEKTGFSIIGRDYCTTVSAGFYDIISATRNNQVHGYWDNIIRLHQTWCPRLTKAELETQSNELRRRLQDLGDTEIPAIGKDLESL